MNKREFANAIRFLSLDAVEKAKSGHPGAPMGMADVAYVLWKKFLRFNPKNPNWANRDRFILSNGHGSMLLYSLLHLTGYKLSISDIKNFRQLNQLLLAIQNAILLLVLRQQLARLAKDLQMLLVWQ